MAGRYKVKKYLLIIVLQEGTAQRGRERKRERNKVEQSGVGKCESCTKNYGNLDRMHLSQMEKRYWVYAKDKGKQPLPRQNRALLFVKLA